MKAVDYTQELPSPEQLRSRWVDVYDANLPRLQIVADLRDVINGKNKVDVPPTVAYKAVVQHSFLLRNAVTAKASRFRHSPEIKVAAQYNSRGNVSPTAEKRASKTEKFFAQLFEQWEQQTSGWQRIVEDAVSYYVAAERIECAPNTDWKDVITLDALAESGDYPMEAGEFKAEREKVKRASGVPIRSVHVPSDSIFWVREGNTTVEVFEVEQRNLRAVLSNPLFEKSEFVRDMKGRDNRGSLKEKITILHYCNNIFHAYYALEPSADSSRNQVWPTGKTLADNAKGTPRLLYSYEHGIGRVIYNIVWGPYGPWDGNVDPMLGRLAALKDLSQDADSYKSQLATLVRRNAWGTMVHAIDPSLRDTADARPNSPITIQEGGIIQTWKDETFGPLQNNLDIAALKYAMEKTEQDFHAIAGVQSQYGIHQEGAATGYHEALLLQQSQSNDMAQEIGLKFGAENRTDIVARYIKHRIGEPVPITHSEVRGGKRVSQYISIGPDDLDPMPAFSASVIAPSPQDFAKTMNNVQIALAPINGRPITDRTTALSVIGNFPNVDEIERNIDIEKAEAAALESAPITNRIVRQMNVILAQKESEIAEAAQFAQADPALVDAASMALPESAAMGGVSPETAMSMEQASIANAAGMQGQGGGLPAGMAQPAQVMGNTDMRMGM